MNIKKRISLLLAAVGILSVILVALPAFAQTSPGPYGGARQGSRAGGQPEVFGTVASVNGTTLTVTSKGFGKTATATTYTVDTTNATVTKNNAASTVADIAVGDTIMIQGTVSGTSVTATAIRDGVMTGGGRGTASSGTKGTSPAVKPVTKRVGTGVGGTVASINGTTLTVTSNAVNGGTVTTYTVDASKATVTKSGATSSVSDISVGDTVMIQGTVSGTSVTATTIRDGVVQPQTAIQGNGQPVTAGSVTSISGNIITITNKSNITYTVDATNAKFSIKGVTSPTISNIAVGDNLTVQGTVSGTSVTASSVIDQKPVASNNTNKTASNPVTGFIGGITNFFKHLFGF
jgi:hypothetical protein